MVKRLYEFIDLFDYIFSLEKEWDRFIMLCFIAGIQQKEIASKMKVSQPYISKRLKIIRDGYKNI